MGMNDGGRGAGRRRRPMAEINVTPMVDVMLVLLVIFMVAAPLLTTGVTVDLPQVKSPPLGQPDDKPLEISVTADGGIYLQETATSLAALAPRLMAITGANPHARIYLRGDAAIQYGRMMAVLGTLHRSGFNRVALITRPARPFKNGR